MSRTWLLCMFFSGCFTQVSGENLPQAEDLCVNACEPIPVQVQDKESLENVVNARVLASRWYGNTWNTVLECKRETLNAENENNSNIDSCFLNSVAGLYQFTVIAAGYENLEKRMRFNSENPLETSGQEFFVCSCMQESTLVFSLEPENGGSE